MRNVDSRIIDAIETGEFSPFLLVKMTIDSVDYTYTDCDIPIMYGGERYEPKGFRINDITYSKAKIVDEAKTELENLDNILTPVFVGGTPQGSEFSIYGVLLDSDNRIIGGFDDNDVQWEDSFVEWVDTYDVRWSNDYATDGGGQLFFQGDIGPWGLKEKKIKLTIQNQFSRWNQRTLSRQSPSCRWSVFGGTECKYAGGETWCDRSYTRCTALGNTINFGGQRWLASIENKDLWWGETPDNSKLS